MIKTNTSISLPPDVYEQIRQLGIKRGMSLAQLVFEACTAQFGLSAREARRQAVRKLGALTLPVGTPEEMEWESVPQPAQS